MQRLMSWLAAWLASFFCLVLPVQAQTASDYTQGVVVSGTTATIWFKPTSSTTTWTDVHYQLNGGATQSLRMTWNPATARSEQNVLTAVAPGNVISYRFTYNKGSPAFDTPTFSFTVGSTGGGTVATPTFSPAPGTYSTPQSVTIASSTSGAQIRYTTDGSTPSATSTLYNGPINVAATLTIKAIGIAGGMTNSAVATGAYTISGGTGGFSFTQGVDVSGTTATIWFQPSQTISFVDVHYTVNNGGQQNFRMTMSGGRYQQNVITPVTNGNVINYWFTYSLTGASAVDTVHFSFTVGSTTPGTVAAPTFNPAPGNYTTAQTVTLATTTAGATIKFTIDGSTPTAASTTYTGPISVPTTRTINAIGIKAGLNNSAVASGTYTIGTNNNAVATPVFTPDPGTYAGAQSVTITTSTAGATIKFTTDGSTPTTASPTYNGPIPIPNTTTIKAMGIKAGLANSPVATGTYTIQTQGGSWNGMTTFTIVNQTNGKWADSQVFFAIIGKDWNTGNFVHVDAGGNLVPMSLGDNGQLQKNGQGYSNYFFSLAQKKTVTIPAINSARLLLSVGSPMYIQVNIDGAGKIAYAGANIENPTDPNIDVTFDFGEFAILPKGNAQQGIFINTTRVDQFGFPLKLRVQGLGGFDKTVGEPLTEGRDALFAKFIAEVPGPFKGLAQAPYAPFRVMAPAHATFQNGGANANYLGPYIDQVWNTYRGRDLVINLNNGWPTFTGRVVGDTFQFNDGLGTYFIHGKPTTSMVMLGNGLLDDPSGAAGGLPHDKQLQLQAQICAALNRHVAENTADWYNQPAHYPAGSLANWYAKFWHDHSLLKLAYGFAYDDVGFFSPSLHVDAPTTVTYTVGW